MQERGPCRKVRNAYGVSGPVDFSCWNDVGFVAAAAAAVPGSNVQVVVVVGCDDAGEGGADDDGLQSQRSGLKRWASCPHVSLFAFTAQGERMIIVSLGMKVPVMDVSRAATRMVSGIGG